MTLRVFCIRFITASKKNTASKKKQWSSILFVAYCCHWSLRRIDVATWKWRVLRKGCGDGGISREAISLYSVIFCSGDRLTGVSPVAGQTPHESKSTSAASFSNLAYLLIPFPQYSLLGSLILYIQTSFHGPSNYKPIVLLFIYCTLISK